MTILDKVTLQQQDTTKIFLFKEGIFYKAYNEGAFLLRDRNYKVTIKKIKSIENEVLSIGFPVSVFDKIKENKQSKVYDNYVCLQTNIVYNDKMYSEWRDNQAATNSNNSGTSNTKEINNKALIESIKNFPLANKTPMEVFMWVANLQKMISN